MPDDARPVPVRSMVAAIGLVLLTYLGYLFVRALHRPILWMLVALFFAVVLSPAVDWLEHRARLHRALATLLVFLVGVGVLVGLMYAFIRPLVDAANEFSDNFPQYVEEAKAGEGPVGGLVERFELDRRIEENQEGIESFVDGLGDQAVDVARAVFSTLFALVTILVLSFLMILEGPAILAAGLQVLPEHRRERVRQVAGDCSKAVSGYMFGNLIISLIAGVMTYAFLKIAGVPFAEVLALWVAFADLIPLVGATLGAIPAVLVALLDSTGAGVATLIFFVVYQQFENHVLQVTIMARTVAINPLMVLVSVLIGVELLGFLGALFAIPAAGMVQVIGRDLWDERQGRLKAEPTVGAEEVPVTEARGAV